jgi:ABC-type sugar transport system, periplasmic component
MKKVLAVALAVALCCASVFANGAKEESAASSDVKLRMMWWGGESRHTPTLAALEKYHEINPNVTVEGEPNGWDGYYQKALTQIAGGTAADLLQIDQPWLADFASKGDVFVDLTNNPNVNLAEFDKNFVDSYCTYNGKIYGLPTGTNVNTMIVDVSMLEKAGIPVDTVWTWENMVTYGKQLHEYNKEWYLNGATPDHVRFWFEVYMAQLAGGVVDKNGKVMFTEAQAVKAFEYFKLWLDNGVVAPFAETSLFYQKFGENPDWVNGNMCLAWTWVSSMMKDIGGRQSMETRPLPVMAGAVDSGVLVRPSQIYVVTAASKNADEAVKLLSWMTCDKDAAAILGTARGVPSSKTGIATAQSVGAITEMTANATTVGVAQSGGAQSIYQMNSQVMQAMQDVIDEFGFGKLTPAEAGKKMVSHLNETLASL